MLKNVFVFSHSPQIKWYSIFMRAIKRFAPDVKVVLFVHGTSDVVYARQFAEYDEIVDLIDGFRYDGSDTSGVPEVSDETLKLESKLGKSFLWEDAKVDRWLRARNDGRFTVQYLNHAFHILSEKYRDECPDFGFGESTMAIYRLAHRMFEGDGKPYLAPIATRYFDRFYFEEDWDWRWKGAIEGYRRFQQHGVPEEIQEAVSGVFRNITETRRKPVAFEEFSVTNSKGFQSFDWLDFRRSFSILRGLSTINREELGDNVRFAVFETSLKEKIGRYLRNQRDYKDYLEIVKPAMPGNGKFCSYFLHYQPEYTVDSLGKFYQDQEYLIGNIANALPADHFLVVKEHVTMVGLRPRSFYQKLVCHPNVILIHHRIDSLNLIQRSRIVFTIVGTCALEAMFLGVPAIMFGRYAFDSTNSISLCTNFWDLGDIVRGKLKEVHQPDEIRQHSLALLAGKYAASYPGKIPRSEQTIDSFVESDEQTGIVMSSMIQFLEDRFRAEEIDSPLHAGQHP